MLTSVVTFLLDRTIDTFSPSPIPDSFLPKWTNLLSKSKEAGNLEQRAWSTYQSVWKRESQPHYPQYNDYVADREKLLRQLVDSKKALSTGARKFWATSSIGQADQTTKCPVFVPDEVMDEIDRIYLTHYHTEDTCDSEVNNLLCFSGHRCSHDVGEGKTPICQITFLDYLRDVEEYLKTRPALKSLNKDHPQITGVTNAAIRLIPLHMPIGVPGRLTLPLPSRSMLQDLWTYIMSADGDLIFEVSLLSIYIFSMVLTT